MRPRQYRVIALCIALNAVDGFDILAISYAAPGIARDWGIDMAALGVVLSMELVGMALGSLLLGRLADRTGRRPAVLACLAIMALGMAACGRARAVGTLAALRLLTGLGIGGMLSAASALVAECSNRRSRAAATAIAAAGYPLGGATGGIVASIALAQGDWHRVFTLGAIASGGLLALALALLPETPAFLLQRRASLSRLNRSLAALGHAPLVQLPHQGPVAPPEPLARLFAPAVRGTTLALTLAYFCHVTTFYFVLKWVPKIVVDFGFTPAQAGRVMVAVSAGGLAGALLASLLSLRIPPRRLAIAGTLLGALAVAGFGLAPRTLPALLWAGAVAGFCTNGALVLFYALVAEAFPTALRGTGTGLVIGIGRGGAALGPVIAGVLLQAGAGVATVTQAMAAGCLLAALVLLAWRGPTASAAPARSAPTA
ncbi:MAG: MFS transporter [Sphingomonadales bacterium]|nr:MFS transporter [Sphingomonadales bacterium]